MTTVIILLIAGLLIEIKWSPRVEYLKESSVFILFWREKNTRKRKIFKI